MEDVPLLMALVTAIACFLATISIWAPRRPPVKLAAVCGTVLLLPLGYAGYIDLLSKPKPVSLEWWASRKDDAAVLGTSIDEGKAIFLWLQLGEAGEPRSYVLPWDKKMAEQLQDAIRAARNSGTGIRMRLPFEATQDDREPKFYAMPQPAMPPKDGEGPPPQYYAPPGSDA